MPGMAANSPRILLVHPPIYDFSAYDFWLKPYGLLRVAGMLRGRAEMRLFDFTDRLHPSAGTTHSSDQWGRGKFPAERVEPPAPLRGVRRRYHRFGLPERAFEQFLAATEPFDAALIQTGMTYWYPGVREVIDTLRETNPRTRTVLGGVYATLCAGHAAGLGADLVVPGTDLTPLWNVLGLEGDPAQPALWEACSRVETGVLKLTDGCPFHCSYCSVPQVYGPFRQRPAETPLAEMEHLARRGATNVAFYDDALLGRFNDVLGPFLTEAARRGLTGKINFHTPNALNARLVTPAAATALTTAGFRTFYLGFESGSADWQAETGGKVSRDEFAAAVAHLADAGAAKTDITAYLILGHPHADRQQIEDSMQFVHSLGVRITLSEFSPIPGTPDGNACAKIVDLAEPLWHNKTAFTLGILGHDEVNRLKAMAKGLNRRLPPP